MTEARDSKFAGTDDRGRTSPLHRVVARLRLAAYTGFTVGASALAIDGEVPWAAIRAAALVAYAYALVAPLAARLFDRRARGARVSLACEVFVAAFTIERLGFSLPVGLFFTLATAITVSMNFGMRFVPPALAVLGGLCGACHWVFETPLSVVSHSIAAQAIFAVGTLAYASVVGGTLHGEAKRVAKLRGELASANVLLESRVAERTAALASTNAAIQRFVPREFLHALGHDDVTTTKLGDATAKSITVLFADIRNFTSSSEGMTPEATFAFLNACLSKLGPHVRAQSGFIDKYIGDAIMAPFPS